MKRIAFLGPEGTVSQEAAKYFFFDQDRDCEFIPCKLISDVFMATDAGQTDLSVVPIENTIESSVSLHLDWLVHEFELPIQAEWVYPSIQNLIGWAVDGEQLDRIKTIYSIPVAIAQCQKFLRKRMPGVQFEHVSSTAEGVKTVKELQDPSAAAIGTTLAAQYYGLQVLAGHINDHEDNFTRFILVGKTAPPLRPGDLTKTTILVTLPEDYPGALHQVLSAFAWRRINLSKIESRPTKKKLGNYYFYIDVEASLNSVLLPAAIEEIKAIGCQVRILGSYPSYFYPRTHSEV